MTRNLAHEPGGGIFKTQIITHSQFFPFGPLPSRKEGNNCVPTLTDTWDFFFSPLSYTRKWSVTRVKEPLRYRRGFQLRSTQFAATPPSGRDRRFSVASIPCGESCLNWAMELLKAIEEWQSSLSSLTDSSSTESCGNWTLHSFTLTCLLLMRTRNLTLDFLSSQIQGNDASPWCLWMGRLILSPICWDFGET